MADAFARWYDLVRNNRFASFNEVRRTFPSADLIGELVVFNIRGNRYRLVTRFIYEKGRVYIRHVLTRAGMIVAIERSELVSVKTNFQHGFRRLRRTARRVSPTPDP